VTAVALGHDRGGQFRARLSGFEETPVVITSGHGRFEASLNQSGDAIQWKLHYSDTNADVTQAHIHIGQRNVAGGITVWLCANNPPITAAPPGTQPCPLRNGDIEGTITAANVLGPPAQGVNAGELAKFVAATQAGLTYANVHTTQSPAGEIRGQISGDDNRRR
jgi:CHRD domain-containing protein